MRCVYCDRETGTPYDEHAECVERSIAESSAEKDVFPMTTAYSLQLGGGGFDYRIRRNDFDGTTVAVVQCVGGEGWVLHRRCEDSSYRRLGVHATPEDAFAAYEEYAAAQAAEPAGPQGPLGPAR